MCTKEATYKILDRAGALITRALPLYDRDRERHEERQFSAASTLFKNEGDDSGTLGRGKENGVKGSSQNLNKIGTQDIPKHQVEFRREAVRAR